MWIYLVETDLCQNKICFLYHFPCSDRCWDSILSYAEQKTMPGHIPHARHLFQNKSSPYLMVLWGAEDNRLPLGATFAVFLFPSSVLDRESSTMWITIVDLWVKLLWYFYLLWGLNQIQSIKATQRTREKWLLWSGGLCIQVHQPIKWYYGTWK